MRNVFNMLEGAGKKKDFSAIKLTLAPPEKIRAWSYGEVRAPETINYRTFNPERGGLFCAKIFGPMKDYECLCGKYKRIKFRGVVCEKCGVEVTLSRVRRDRMGHINLACPVAHILFFKALPSRIGLVLDLTMRDIERILYFEVYVVIDPGRTELERGQLLKVAEYQEMWEKHPRGFKAGIGAEGVRDFLKKIDLAEESKILRGELDRAGSDTRRKKIFKRLKIIENFERAGLRPEWMVLEALPVLPPELRPLVQLEGGRFTTSDLNDLYRRVINRNNRLKRLMDLDAPDVIINNEKRMLQESVDSLLDNGRRGKPATGANRRPLKSVADIIKGKSGRFRQNLLGKRVDFSGRSVIVVGPNLKLHQCGLPKKMALTLFRPFVYNKLTEGGYAASVKNARAMVEAEDPQVWGVLEEVIAQHPVLLNRAPTLHRLGVQAFEPVLIEGKAIQLHPLVCVAFNADFDGDQMAVHVPLSLEAQAEARVLMLSSNNVLAPANGEPIIVPTQDVVLGMYYATREITDAPGRGMRFSDIGEVERALNAGAVILHTPIEVRMENDLAAQTRDEREEDGESGMRLVKTTVGRALAKRFLPAKLPFSMINRTIKKRDIVSLVKESFWRCGHRETVIFCDQLMRFGFEQATRAGISVCMDDMIVPPQKAEIIRRTEAKIEETHRQFQNGLLTEDERYNKSVDLWDKTGEEVSRVMMESISREPATDADGRARKNAAGNAEERESFNSIYMMADSGARGSETQIKQLAGMRGLMTKPDGRIMENAITANFREGLSVLQYFISTHGARKGLSDTALKTANSGYLTRRLVDVTQDIVVSEMDCGSTGGILLRPVLKDGNELVSLADRLAGRTLAADVRHPQSGKAAYKAGDYITEKEAREIAEELGADEVKVRSPVTCETHFGLCAKCYGRDLGRGGKVCLGEAVGVVAAQSIGEPGTQLTMRTFHIGGAASREVVADNINARYSGVTRLHAARYVTNQAGDLVIVSRGGEMSVQEAGGRERERYRLQYGQVLKVKEGEKVERGQLLSNRNPMSRPIIAEYEGAAKLENIEMGVNAREQMDENTGLSVVTITENKQGTKKAKQPQMKFIGPDGNEVMIRGTETPVTIALLPGTILDSKVCSPQIAAEHAGVVKLENVEIGINAREEKNEKTGHAEIIITGGKQDGKSAQQPRMKFIGANGKEVVARGTDKPAAAMLVPGAVLSVKTRDGNKIDGGKVRAGDIVARVPERVDGGRISIGDVVAKVPQKAAKSRDITGGLPRVAELFEAREPKEPAILAKSSGRAVLLGIQRTKQVLAIADDNKKESRDIPAKYKILLKEGAAVKRGDAIASASGEADILAELDGLLSIHEKHRDKKELAAETCREVMALCRPDKAPARLKRWAEKITARLESFSGPLKKLRGIVADEQKILERIVSGAGGAGLPPKKLRDWRQGFIERVRPNPKDAGKDWDKLSAPLARWAAETLAQLEKSKEGRNYDDLRKIVSAAGKSLAKLADCAESKRRLDSWQKRADAIESEYETMSPVVAETDARALKKEAALLERMKTAAANISANKTAGGEKTVEVVAAQFQSIPKGRTILVQDGSYVGKGEEIVDGDINPHEILAMRGEEALVEHIVNEVQDVYRLQGVNISDKHIEVIIHQMLRCASIVHPGDSHLIPGDHIMRSELLRINEELKQAGKKQVKTRPVLMGITKASLATDSFISAASFQETSRVLTEAAVAGQRDFLRGLKENVIIGRLVPTGTGFVHYQKNKERDAEMEAQQFLRDELEPAENAPDGDSPETEKTGPALAADG